MLKCEARQHRRKLRHKKKKGQSQEGRADAVAPGWGPAQGMPRTRARARDPSLAAPHGPGQLPTPPHPAARDAPCRGHLSSSGVASRQQQHPQANHLLSSGSFVRSAEPLQTHEVRTAPGPSALLSPSNTSRRAPSRDGAARGRGVIS